MQVANIKDFIGGWFIGNFEPNLTFSEDFEVAVKYYKQGDEEKRHFHKLAIEYTVIAKGKVVMNDTVFNEGSIIKIEKGESTDFKVLEDTITVVVKLPSVKNDKFVIE